MRSRSDLKWTSLEQCGFLEKKLPNYAEEKSKGIKKLGEFLDRTADEFVVKWDPASLDWKGKTSPAGTEAETKRWYLTSIREVSVSYL